MTRVLVVDPDHPDAGLIATAAECLRAGGLVAFPTETVYGLGVNALDRDAVRRLFAAKGRPSTDPLIVHLSSVDAIAPLVAARPAALERLASRFWPGPLTVVMPRAPVIPDEITAGLDTVAIRIPVHPVALALIEAAGVPVAAPSANLFSRPSPTRAAHVLEDLDGRIDMVIDGGETHVGVESTVLDLSSDPATILRPGAVTREMLMDVLHDVRVREDAVSGEQAHRSPGLLEKHYSPRAPLTLYEGPDAVSLLLHDAYVACEMEERVGLLVAPGDLPPGDDLRRRCIVREIGPDAAAVARNLYAVLRELDASHVNVILARAFPTDDGLGAAIHDRLRRAAAGRVVCR